MARVTPEERRSIFADVQARSRAAKEKRREQRRGMASSVADVHPYTTEKITVAPKMNPGSSVAPTIKGAMGAIRKRNKALEEVMK